MKLGIIRCMQTEDFCPGTGDFKAIRNKTGVFADVKEEIELVGFANCGGCPGKRAVLRARELVKRGADTIAFASCIQKKVCRNTRCAFFFSLTIKIDSFFLSCDILRISLIYAFATSK